MAAGDSMNLMKEQFAMKLECGHPNTDPGAFCVLCNTITPSDGLKIEYTLESDKPEPQKVENITIHAEDVGNVDDVLGKSEQK